MSDGYSKITSVSLGVFAAIADSAGTKKSIAETCWKQGAFEGYQSHVYFFIN